MSGKKISARRPPPRRLPSKLRVEPSPPDTPESPAASDAEAVHNTIPVKKSVLAASSGADVEPVGKILTA
jgi:hypothetical protein